LTYFDLAATALKRPITADVADLNAASSGPDVRMSAEIPQTDASADCIHFNGTADVQRPDIAACGDQPSFSLDRAF
jgi:hypothetical protein